MQLFLELKEWGSDNGEEGRTVVLYKRLHVSHNLTITPMGCTRHARDIVVALENCGWLRVQYEGDCEKSLSA